jgi:DNA-directed RNA polymerase specialized sigma24 family protein
VAYAYARTVYHHAFRLTGERPAAEDVMSLTFLEAWRQHVRVGPEAGSLRPWLPGTATKPAGNQRRAARPRVVHSGSPRVVHPATGSFTP